MTKLKLILMTIYALIITPIILIGGLVLNLTIGQKKTHALMVKAQEWVAQKQR